jgi:glycosyltransferase involved in cell wall biosynthesis
VDQVNDYLLVVDRPIAWAPPQNWRVQVIATHLSSLGVVWREQVALPRFLRGRHVDCLHLPCATGPLWCPVPVVVTIHDVIEFTEPLPSPLHPKRWAMRLYSRLVQRIVARRVRAIITVSDYSKDRVACCLHVAPGKIHVTYEAPSAAYKRIDRQMAIAHVADRFGVTHYALAFASEAPRKNIDRLLEAYAGLDIEIKRHHPLCLVCTHPSVRARLDVQAQKLSLTDHLMVIERPSDEELLWLYNAACLFIFPSLDEGFGLPPLEAMRCGVPVIASNAGSLPEVLGDAARLVSPTDIEGLAESIQSVLTQPKLQQELSRRGLEHSAHFSWHLTARETVKVYEATGYVSSSA